MAAASLHPLAVACALAALLLPAGAQSSCEAMLRTDCGGRGLGAAMCLACAARHPVDLRHAGCIQSDIVAWCDSKGPGQTKCPYSGVDNCTAPGGGCEWCAAGDNVAANGLCCGAKASCCSSLHSGSCCGGAAFCCSTARTNKCCETGTTCCHPTTPSAGGNRTSTACCKTGATCCGGGLSGEANCCEAPFKCCPGGAPGCCR